MGNKEQGKKAERLSIYYKWTNTVHKMEVILADQTIYYCLFLLVLSLSPPTFIPNFPSLLILFL